MTTSTITQNELLLLSLISIFATIFLFQIIEIESKFIKNCIGDVAKNIFAVFILSRITINLISCISEKKIESETLKVLNIFYENYIWIILILGVFYIIDRLIEKKISCNYLIYVIYSIILFLYTNLSLNKSLWIVVLSCLALYVFNMKKYKQVINKKYTDIKSINKFSYITYIIAGFILVYSSINSIINNSNYKLVGIFILYYSFIWKKYRIKKKDKDKEKSKINELSDKEIDSVDRLFETRKKELKYIMNYFETHVDKIEEPFAISISGKWGEGKSSLTNVLKKKLEDKYIIFDIQPMVTDTREGLIKYFFSNLEKQFIYYGLSVGSGSSIENYFTSILKLIDSKGLLSIKQEVKNIKSNKFDLRESKEELQNDINLLKKESGKNILIVVDDFDRVDNDVKYSILTFIKEVINFDGIKSLILLDYSILDKNNDSKITYEFLEKFINKRFELSKLSIEEILTYYKNVLSEEESSELKNNLDIELDNLIKNIDLEIEKIKISIKEKIKKKEEYILKESKKDNEDKNQIIIDNKEKNIDTLKRLELSIHSSTINIRKLKRILREITDKVDYTKYIYSEFTLEDKNELIENINIKSIIISIVIIKVLYEKEFDIILKHKNFLKYIEKNKNTEAYELIYCTIFEESDKTNHMYKINTIDYKVIEFINNVFICINTPKDMFDFRIEEQKLLDIISTKPVNFKNDKTVFENIKNVYKNVNYHKLKYKMENISEYISEKLENGEIKLTNSIQLIRIDESFNSIVKYNKKYINTLRKILENKKISYNQISQKQLDEQILESSISDIIDSIKHTVAFIITYKNIQFRESLYNEIREDLLDYDSIEMINKYAKDVLNDIELDNSLTDIEVFLKWANIKKIYDDNIDCEKINEDIIDSVGILQDLEFIKNAIKKSTMKNKSTYEYTYMNYQELIEELKQIKSNIIDKNISEHQIYNLTLGISRITYILYKEYIESLTIGNIKLLDELTSIVYREFSFENEEIDILLKGIQLRLLDIKKSKGQLKTLK